jgi:hypothetical protein
VAPLVNRGGGQLREAGENSDAGRNCEVGAKQASGWCGRRIAVVTTHARRKRSPALGDA